MLHRMARLSPAYFQYRSNFTGSDSQKKYKNKLSFSKRQSESASYCTSEAVHNIDSILVNMEWKNTIYECFHILVSDLEADYKRMTHLRFKRMTQDAKRPILSDQITTRPTLRHLQSSWICNHGATKHNHQHEIHPFTQEANRTGKALPFPANMEATEHGGDNTANQPSQEVK